MSEHRRVLEPNLIDSARAEGTWISPSGGPPMTPNCAEGRCSDCNERMCGCACHDATWLSLGKPERPLTEVCIDTPGPTITIKAAGDLDTIAAKALAIFHEVDKVDRGKSPGPAAGFSTERSWEP